VRVGLAVADAFIACWQTKYTYNLLRPVTYINQLLDPAWAPLLVTPPFPEYTSGHSVQSGAAATVLTDLFGERPFTDTTHVTHGLLPPLAPRSFASFVEAAAEAGISRLYGGIHFRPAIERGLEQGRCVGQTVLGRIHFREERHDGRLPPREAMSGDR
jgi:membrane-associated phospholipid phosphatase